MTTEDHTAAWDARDRLTAELAQCKHLPERTLYIRRDDGGTLGFGLLSKGRGLLLIDWSGSAYETQVFHNPVLRFDPYEQKADGFGGMFGFGEKGARGWMLRLIDGGAVQAEIPVLPNITAVADLLANEDRFLSGKRKPREIPLWQPRPEEGALVERILTIWEQLVLKNG